MSINPLIPLAGAYAIEVAKQVARPLASGATFAQTLLAGSALPAAAKPPRPVDQDQYLPSAHAVAAASAADAANRSLAEFQTLLRQRMSAAGLDPSAPMLLRSDVFGEFGSVEGHPQAAGVENLLARDPELSRAFEQLVQRFQRSRASGQRKSPVEFLIDSKGIRVL